MLPTPTFGQAMRRGIGTLLLIVAAGLAGCATPVAPTGGPVDEIPPLVRSVEPADQTVHFAGDRLTLVFSEYVDQASFQQAFSITPAFETPPDVGWRGRRVRITFPEPLRENTTYIFTIGTELTDLNRNALDRPIVLAVSTGSRIDRGRIEGVVRDPVADRPVEKIDLFAYMVGADTADSLDIDPFERAPDYRTQTGADGRFAFAYLAERRFFILALEDRNRNRRLDPGEGFAVPPHPAIPAAPAAPPDSLAFMPDSLAVPDAGVDALDVRVEPSAGVAGRWYLARSDTSAPELQRLRTLSSRRLQLRFSEPVMLATADPAAWSVEDSLSGRIVPVRAVYHRPEDPPAVHVVTDSLPPVPHRLRTTAVRDTLGNGFPDAWHPFTPVARADTFRVRFAGFRPDPPFERVDTLVTLLPGEAPGLAFSQSVSEAELRRWTTLADTAGQAVPFVVETDDGVAYRLRPDPPLAPGRVLRLTLDARAIGRDTVYVQSYRLLPTEDRGEIAGVVRPPAGPAAGPAGGPVRVELYRQADRPPPVRVAAVQPDSTGRFLFRDVPAGVYKVRAFVDRDSSGTWSGGAVRPYVPAEPVVWSADSVAARARWEIPFPDTLRLHAVPDATFPN